MIKLLLLLLALYIYTGLIISIEGHIASKCEWKVQDVLIIFFWPYVLKIVLQKVKSSTPEITNPIIDKNLVESAEPMPKLFVSIPYNKFAEDKEKELVSRMVETAKKKFNVVEFEVVLGVDPIANAKKRANQIMDSDYFVGLLNKSLYDKYPELDKDNYICTYIVPDTLKKFFIQVVHE